MKTRISRLLAVGWGLFTVVVMFLPFRASVPLIFFLSGYAIVVAHLAEWAGHRSEEQTAGTLAVLNAKLDALLAVHGDDPIVVSHLAEWAGHRAEESKEE